jgi:LPXTG-site transpeptidase (sortase) family protein
MPTDFTVQALEEVGEGQKVDALTAEILPTRLVLPNVNIDIPITPGSVLDGNWQLSAKSVSLLQIPLQGSNERGYVLYGHNWPVLLGNMRKVKVGEQLSLNYPDGESKEYAVTSVFRVDADQLSILDLAKPDTLVLYTCIGFLDSQRLVVLAQLAQ